jgi:hypothetical protein
MRGICALCLLVLAACGGSERAGRDSRGPAGGGGTAVGRPPAASDALTREECGAMLDHIVDIGHAEQKRTLAPDAVPTPEQIAAIKKKQRESSTDACLPLSRGVYECAMRARSPAELGGCEDGP